MSALWRWGKRDCGDFDSPLPALSTHHDKWSILESIMDGDAEALFSPDIELSSSLTRAFSRLAEHTLTVCLGRVVCPICFFGHARETA